MITQPLIILCESTLSTESKGSCLSNNLLVFEHTCAYARRAHMHRFASVWCHLTKTQDWYHLTKTQDQKIIHLQFFSEINVMSLAGVLNVKLHFFQFWHSVFSFLHDFYKEISES